MTDKKIKILVVDDEATARSGLAKLLEHEGYSVSVAADGREALEAVADVAPALIITDLKMPVMDGMELLAQLRREASASPRSWRQRSARCRRPWPPCGQAPRTT